MIPDLSDTIAAIGTAPGGAVRGMIRVSGPDTIECLARCFQSSHGEQQLTEVDFAQVVVGDLVLDELPRLPCEVYLWPNEQSYTRQLTAELHTLGSPPLLEQVLATICRSGARLAEPGEFTLRAFLAGRLDLTQAEAVLGVIEAADSESLQTALGQLAGGLSKPLTRLREQLLQLLAHLEAGLDFVEEDISFISSAELERQITAAAELVAATLAQLASRSQPQVLPKVVLVGQPNAGKSTLFNALVERFGIAGTPNRALVSDLAGTTRDYLAAVVNFQGLVCELVDTAGVDPFAGQSSIAGIAQDMTSAQRRQADCSVLCVDSTDIESQTIRQEVNRTLTAITKIDLLCSALDLSKDPRIIACSSRTELGLNELSSAIHEVLSQRNASASAVASTSARCTESLRCSLDSLQAALKLVNDHAGDELVATEVRTALQELGRVVGAVYTDDVLDRIFSQFCIGK